MDTFNVVTNRESFLKVPVTSRALTWCWRHERMPGKKISSFLCATTQIVCPLRWRLWYVLHNVESVYFIVTLYYKTEQYNNIITIYLTFDILNFIFL